MNISPLRPSINSQSISELRTNTKQTQQSSQSGATFNQLLESLDQAENTSDALMQKLAAGEEVELHQVMIAAEQTDISFRVAMAIRDKLVEAYRDTMHMSV
jgi:flagellar hook-basal body complex protein FliE